MPTSTSLGQIRGVAPPAATAPPLALEEGGGQPETSSSLGSVVTFVLLVAAGVAVGLYAALAPSR